MVYIIPNFLVLHFGENFMKIGIKIAKLQMYENLHNNVNFHSHFYAIFHKVLRRTTKQTNMLQLYTANISYIPFRMVFLFF